MPEFNDNNEIEDLVPEIPAEESQKIPDSVQRLGGQKGDYKDFEVETFRAGHDAILANRLGVRIAHGLAILSEKLFFKSLVGDELLKIESKEEIGSSVAGKFTILAPHRPFNGAAASVEAGGFNEEGMTYYDTTSKKIRQYINGTWGDVGGGVDTSVTVTTHDNTATGAVNYAHGLGKIPTEVRIDALGGTSPTDFSLGKYDGTSNMCVFGGSNAGNSNSNVVWIDQGGGNFSYGAITAIDATNVTITWAKSGAPASSCNLLITATG